MHKFYFILLIFIATNLQAQKSASFFRTSPSNATVYDMEKNELGVTPFDLRKLKPEITKIKITKEGFDPAEIEFSEKEKNGISFPHSVVFCPKCNLLIDSNISNDEYTGALILRKKIKDHDNVLMIAIDTPQITIAPKTEIGKINYDRKLINDRDIHMVLGYPENMQNQLINCFRNSYIEAYFISEKEKERANLYKPKVILRPLVRRIDFKLKGRLLRDYTGPCMIECTWQVSDISDRTKVIGQFDVITSVYRFQGNYDLILHQMLSESERDLLDNDTLYDFLTRVEKNYLSKSKKEVINIQTSLPVSYNTTKDMLKGIASSVVTIENEDIFGSGSIISPTGYILTSYHVITGEKNIFVRRGIEEKIKAEIVKTNKDYDLALLKINISDWKPLAIGNSEKADIGDEIFAAGTPAEKSLKQSITKGIISGFRQWNGVNFIQTDVTINPGNSGGPMLNSKGEIIGITTMKLIGKGIEGIGFGIPSNVAIEMLNLKLEYK